MTGSQRMITVVATVLVLVVAFVVLRPGDDDDKASTTGTTATEPIVSPPLSETTTAPVPPPPPPAPEYEKVRVRGGKPVGGVKKIELTKGDRARIEVSSPDTSDEIHIHGYDLAKNLKAGGRVRFLFTANADGIYEIELEGAGVPIAELVVQPG